MRETDLIGMSTRSRGLLARSIMERYVELEPSDGSESLGDEAEQERADQSDSS